MAPRRPRPCTSERVYPRSVPSPRLAPRALSVLVLVAACHPEPPLVAQVPGTPSAAVAARTASSAAPVASPRLQPEQPALPEPIQLGGGASVTLRPRGSALIELTLQRGQLPPSVVVEVERRPEAVGGAQRDSFDPGGHPLLHTTTMGPAYLYRARGGGDWSKEVAVRIAEPTTPPPAPTALDVEAVSPYVARVAWQADEQEVAGFEIQVDKDEKFVRAALANPFDRAFLLHGRVPDRRYTLRVRAFNARGASLPTEPVTITMPTSFEPANLPPLRRCEAGVPLAPSGSPGCDPDPLQLEAGEGRILYNLPIRGNGCRRRLVGRYQGCMREFGAFELQADVVAVPAWFDQGWPLLLAVAGAGEYVGAQIWTLRFSEGRYLKVDETEYCGERWPEADELHVGVEEEELVRCSPPFEPCQVDYPF